MNKKRVSIVLALALGMMLLFAACGNQAPAQPAAPAAPAAPADPGAAAEEPAWVWERPVEFIINWDPGSGTDQTMRAFAPHLERELGVPVNMQNVSGAGGLTGAEFFHQQPADGYTFSMYTPSHTIAGVRDVMTFDIINETEPIANLVWAVRVLLAGNHVPFTTFEEFVELARQYPYRFTVGCLSPTGIDGVGLTELFDLAGISVNIIGYGSRADANAAVIGGHIDMVLGDTIDAQFIDSGDMIGLVVKSDTRLASFPDIPTTVELGYNAVIGPWRALVARRGVPEAALQAMSEAVERANQAPEWQQWLSDNDLDARDAFMNREEFTQFWFDQYEVFKYALAALE